MPRDGTATRTRILDAAESLVIENGFSATSLEEILAAAATSKGAFFHHFDSKLALAEALTSRYAAADRAHLDRALAAVAEQPNPRERLVAFLTLFEDEADELMAAQSSCLYVAMLAERQLISAGSTAHIAGAIKAWRDALVQLIREAGIGGEIDAAALADHVFVTFEGAFVLCRSTGDNGHMRRQLRVLRQLVAAQMDVAPPRPLIANPCQSVCVWRATGQRIGPDPLFVCEGCESEWVRSQAWTPIDWQGEIPEAVLAERARPVG